MLFRNWFKGRAAGTDGSSRSTTTSPSARASAQETFKAVVARRSEHRRRRSSSPRQNGEDDFYSDEDSDDEDYSSDEEEDGAAIDNYDDRGRILLSGGRNQSTAAFRRSHVARSFQSVGSNSSDGRMFPRREEHMRMTSTSMTSVHTNTRASTGAKLEPAVLKDLEVLFDEVSENAEEKEDSEQAASRDLAVFQQSLVDNLDQVKSKVCEEFVDWEQQRQRSEGPVSNLLECLAQLDSDLEQAMRKLDDKTRSMYEFKKDTEEVQQEMSLRLEKNNWRT